ncbi:MAG: aquaporin [Candidatus Micrarchaeota archaeon]|nr:aquaporin [Candidatus Micrarchaeota archaeon]
MDDYRPYVSEFLGTFGLVFIGAGAVLVNGLTGGAVGLTGIALAHGLVLMVMIYALAGFSGAHFNPAITVALWAQKRVDSAKAAAYVASQLLGAAAAGILLGQLFPAATAAQLYGFPATVEPAFGVLLEAVLTFFLVSSVYAFAVSKKAPAHVFGAGIGLVLAFDILVGGPFTGGAMNPARAFGPALASGVWGPQLVYWAGPILGALAASLVWEYMLNERRGKK